MQLSRKCALSLFSTLFVVMAMLLTACGGGSSQGNQQAPKSQQHMRFAFNGGNGNGDVSTLDPALDGDAPSSDAIQMVFTGLVQFDDKLQIQGQLASSWDHDGTTWTFHLKPNLKFSDGTPLTAQDVAYSINRALSPDINNLSGGLAATYLGLIKDSAAFTNGDASAPKTLIGDSIIVKDPNTLELILDHDTGYFLQAFSYPTSWVVEKSLIDKWGNTKWTDHLTDGGGAGPFKVTSYNHTTGIKFVPNPNYYGKQPALQEVDYNFYKDVNTEYKAYQANQVDFSGIPSQLIPSQKGPLGTQYRQSPALASYSIFMNYLYQPFNNIKIRQAFELAINKDLINASILQGVDIPTCHIVPSGMPGYNANLKCPGGAATSGDPILAKQLLQEGMQEEHITQLPPITLTYHTNSTTLAKIVTAIRQMWQQVLNVSVNTNTMDFGKLLVAQQQTVCSPSASLESCMNKGLQIWMAGWLADYPDPQDWTTLQFGKGAGYNQVNYGQNLSSDAAKQQQTQAALAAADLMTNGPARYVAYNTAEQQLVNDVTWIPIYQNRSVEAIKPYIHGWIDNALAIVPPDDWSNIYVTVH